MPTPRISGRAVLKFARTCLELGEAAGGTQWLGGGADEVPPSQVMKVGEAHLLDEIHSPEDWMLPPPYISLHREGQDNSDWGAPRVLGVELRSADCAAAASRKRLCGVCGILEAKKGIETPDGLGMWASVLCKVCSHSRQGCTDLVARCLECKRWASFGAPGASRQDATHCSRHRLAGHVSVAAAASHTKGRSASPKMSDMLMACEGGFDAAAAGGGGSKAGGGEWEESDVSSWGPISKGRGEWLPWSTGDGQGDSSCVSSGGSHRACTAEGCERRGGFVQRGASGARLCRLHKTPGCVPAPSSGRECAEEGCCKRSNYGDPYNLGLRYCANHKAPHHVNLNSPRCESIGCGRQPSFGDAAEGTARFCREHRRVGDANVRHARCEGAECTKIPAFGFVGGAAKFCAAHKPASAVNLLRLRSRSTTPTGRSRSESVGEAVDEVTRLKHRACAVETLRGAALMQQQHGGMMGQGQMAGLMI